MCGYKCSSTPTAEPEAIIVEASAVEMQKWIKTLGDAMFYVGLSSSETTHNLREMRVLLTKVLRAKTPQSPHAGWLDQEIGRADPCQFPIDDRRRYGRAQL